MYLKDLIAKLEQYEPTMSVPLGFSCPHSYRGYYDQLAFVPTEHTTAGKMLKSAKEALGNRYSGWHGGEYVMTEYTDVWLAEVGHSPGETIGPILLSFMLGDRK